MIRIDIDEVDLSRTPDMEALLLSAANRSPFLVADLSRVTFMTSSGIGALVGVWKHLQEAGGDLALAGCTPTVMRVVEICGVNQAISCHPTVAEALGALSARATA